MKRLRRIRFYDKMTSNASNILSNIIQGNTTKTKLIEKHSFVFTLSNVFDVHILPKIYQNLCKIYPELVRGAPPLKLSLWSRVSYRVSLVTLKQITL